MPSSTFANRCAGGVISPQQGWWGEAFENAAGSARNKRMQMTGQIARPEHAFIIDWFRRRRTETCKTKNQKSETESAVSHSRHLHAGQFAGEAGLADLLEHLSHLSILAEQIVHFLHAGS